MAEPSDPRAKLYTEGLWVGMVRDRERIYQPQMVSSRDDFEHEFGLDPPVALRRRHDQLYRDREAFARRLLEDRLPRFLHWTLERPRALRWVLKLAPRWRPTMTVVDLRGRTPVQHAARMISTDPDGRVPTEMPYPSMTAETARVVGDGWIAEMRAHGNRVPDGGLIFTYTDPSGLPAEVYL